MEAQYHFSFAASLDDSSKVLEAKSQACCTDRHTSLLNSPMSR